MKKYNHPIDDLFRESLKDHQMKPSGAAKKAFLQDAMQISQPEKKGRTGLILLSVIFVLMSGGILIWAVTSDNFSSVANETVNPVTEQQLAAAPGANQPEKQSHASAISQQNKTNAVSAHNSDQVPVAKSSTQSSDQDPGSLKDHKKQKPTGQLSLKTDQPAIHTTPDPSTNTQQLSKDDQITSAKKTEVAQAASVAAISPGTNARANSGNASTHENNISQPDNMQEAALIEPGPVVSPVVPAPDPTKPNSSDSVPIPAPGAKTKSPQANGNSSKWIPDVGVYYTLEWMFNTLEGTKFVNNFGVEGTFHFGKFSVRTGAGLSIAKGTNEVVVEYNDFLGAYNKLDSMNFKWDDPTHNYVPTMYLSKKDVWDSLMKLDYAKVVKRYTYMQIPLIMGYDFWRTERISMGFRAGPVLSVLLASKQLSAAYDPGTKRIISVNDISPEQVNLNWQVMGGINTAIKLSESLFFELEPSVRYYFNSVYEKPVNNTKPWSVGVRGAFVIQF